MLIPSVLSVVWVADTRGGACARLLNFWAVEWDRVLSLISFVSVKEDYSVTFLWSWTSIIIRTHYTRIRWDWTRHLPPKGAIRQWMNPLQLCKLMLDGCGTKVQGKGEKRKKRKSNNNCFPGHHWCALAELLGLMIFSANVSILHFHLIECSFFFTNYIISWIDMKINVMSPFCFNGTKLCLFAVLNEILNPRFHIFILC